MYNFLRRVSDGSIKVSAKSSQIQLQGHWQGSTRERRSGDSGYRGGAINQAVKAIAIARGFVAPGGMDLICIPAFTDIMIDGEEEPLLS